MDILNVSSHPVDKNQNNSTFSTITILAQRLLKCSYNSSFLLKISKDQIRGVPFETYNSVNPHKKIWPKTTSLWNKLHGSALYN